MGEPRGVVPGAGRAELEDRDGRDGRGRSWSPPTSGSTSLRGRARRPALLFQVDARLPGAGGRPAVRRRPGQDRVPGQPQDAFRAELHPADVAALDASLAGHLRRWGYGYVATGGDGASAVQVLRMARAAAAAPSSTGPSDRSAASSPRRAVTCGRGLLAAAAAAAGRCPTARCGGRSWPRPSAGPTRSTPSRWPPPAAGCGPRSVPGCCWAAAAGGRRQRRLPGREPAVPGGGPPDRLPGDRRLLQVAGLRPAGGGHPGVEVAVVHLVRDPRATAWSFLRKRLPASATTASCSASTPSSAPVAGACGRRRPSCCGAAVTGATSGSATRTSSATRRRPSGASPPWPARPRPLPFSGPATVRLTATHSVSGSEPVRDRRGRAARRRGVAPGPCRPRPGHGDRPDLAAAAALPLPAAVTPG